MTRFALPLLTTLLLTGAALGQTTYQQTNLPCEIKSCYGATFTNGDTLSYTDGIQALGSQPFNGQVILDGTAYNDFAGTATYYIGTGKDACYHCWYEDLTGTFDGGRYKLFEHIKVVCSWRGACSQKDMIGRLTVP